ncbi:MAG: hypothetical protein HZB31_05740 [Nitrospirae bacterium]|nr:hypothetical protein [Nitrospirota bacterium]
MGKFRRRGAETVEAGTYWNFESGNKVNLKQGGLLPGDPSQSYYKAPPLLILALAAAAAHLFMYVLPKYLVQLYAAYVDNLIRAYVIFDFVLLGAAVTGLLVMSFRDLSSGAVRLPSLRSETLAPIKVRNDDTPQD